MLKAKLSILCLLITLFSFTSIGIAIAQDEDLTSVEPLTGYEFLLPEGWDYDYTEEDAAYFFNDIYFLNFDFYLAEDLEGQEIPADDLMGAMELVFFGLDESISFSDVTAEEASMDDLDYIYVEFTDTVDGEAFPVFFSGMYLQDGSFIYGRLYPNEGDDEIPSDLVEDSLLILNSLQAVESNFTIVEPLTGYEFALAEGWEFDYTDDEAAFFYKDIYNLNFDFYDSVYLEENDVPADDLMVAAELMFYAIDENISFDDVVAEEDRIAGIELVRVDYEDQVDELAYPVTYFLFYLEDGTLMEGAIYPFEGDDEIPAELLQEAVKLLNTMTAIE